MLNVPSLLIELSNLSGGILKGELHPISKLDMFCVLSGIYQSCLKIM